MLHACCLSRAPGSGFRAVCRPPLADGKHRCGDEGDEDTKAHQDDSGASDHVGPYADETAMAWSRSESLAARCAPGNGPIRPVTHHRHNNLRKPTRTSAYPAAVSQPHSPALAPAVSHSHSHSRSPSLGLNLARRSSSLAGMHAKVARTDFAGPKFPAPLLGRVLKIALVLCGLGRAVGSTELSCSDRLPCAGLIS